MHAVLGVMVLTEDYGSTCVVVGSINLHVVQIVPHRGRCVKHVEFPIDFMEIVNMQRTHATSHRVMASL